jgi:hypothetical protein
MGVPRMRAAARALLAVLAASATVLALTGGPAHAAAVTVVNATQFTDTTGAVVHAHGGGVIKVGAYYYWFGENRNADNTFRYVSAYRSTDLRTWEFRNHVLTQASAGELASANIERPKVIYNAATGQFVMWMHKETATDYGQARAAVAVSSTVDGAYTYRGSFRPLGTYMSRDITTFVDDDGTGYMVSSANENRDLNVYRLTADYTGVAALVRTWPGDVREAPALFKRNGVYFMLTSGATGWSPNQQKYSSATAITGTWSAWSNVGDATAYGSQTAYVLPIAGTSTTSYLYLGDRWGNSIGGTVNDSRYVWLPLRFPSSTTLAMDYFSSLVIDAAAGTVTGPTGTYYNVVARHSGKCMDVVGGSTADLAEVIQYACGTGINQQWRRVDLGNGYVQLEARHSGKCLDVADRSTADNARIVQFACGTGTNQQWQLQDAGGGYQRLVARHSGKCLDVIGGGTADGVRLIQYACGTGSNQQWLSRTP